MDPLFLAYSCYRRKKYQECADICSELLEKNPYDQVLLQGLKLLSQGGVTGREPMLESRFFPGTHIYSPNL